MNQARTRHEPGLSQELCSGLPDGLHAHYQGDGLEVGAAETPKCDDRIAGGGFTCQATTLLLQPAS